MVGYQICKNKKREIMQGRGNCIKRAWLIAEVDFLFNMVKEGIPYLA